MSICLCVHAFEYFHSQWAYNNEILSESSLGMGKECVRFKDRLDQNSGFHGSRYMNMCSSHRTIMG